MRPLDSCDLCFKEGKSDFVEIYKNQFQSVRKIHSVAQNLAEQILDRHNVRIEQGYRGSLMFQTPNEQRREIIDSLKDVGIPIHSLLDHITKYSQFYGSPRRERLGSLTFIRLPVEGSWYAMEPKSKKWNRLTVYHSEVSGSNVRINSVLKHDFRGTEYYKVIGKKEKPLLIPIESAAAYNLMADQFDDAVVYWIEKPGGIAVVSTDMLSHIPSDFFETLVRLRPVRDYIKGYLTFDQEDYPLVEKLLSLIRIKIISEADAKIIKSRTTPKKTTIFFLNSLPKEKLELALSILKVMGAKTENSEKSVSIYGVRKKIVLQFYDLPKSSIESNCLFLSRDVLSNPSRLETVLNQIRKICGLNKEFIDFLIARDWPVFSTEDLNYVIQSAVGFYEIDPYKAKEIVLRHRNMIKNWYDAVVSNEIKTDQNTSFAIGKLLRN